MGKLGATRHWEERGKRVKGNWEKAGVGGSEGKGPGENVGKGRQGENQARGPGENGDS